MPWGHHKCIIDKCSDNPKKAVFYVQQTVENGWSRSMLLNFIDADLYGRQGKARKEGRDNPTIGLLICKEKDGLVAQYAVEASSQPLGISEYDLAALYPEKVEGTIPTIEEIETKLTNMDEE